MTKQLVEEVREYNFNVKTDRSQYGRVFFASKECGVSMSEFIRLCIEVGMVDVKSNLMRAKYAKN